MEQHRVILGEIHNVIVNCELSIDILKFDTDHLSILFRHHNQTSVRPVEGVVEVGEDVDEDGRVVLLQAVPQVLQHGQHDVHAVAQVQRNQDVTEAVSGLEKAGQPQNLKADVPPSLKRWRRRQDFHRCQSCR